VERKSTAIMIKVTVANPRICRRSRAVPRRHRTISDARAISQPRPTTVDQKYHSYKLLTVGKLYAFMSVAITTSPTETPSRIFQSLPGRGPSGYS
jgi:hypothetical protein